MRRWVASADTVRFGAFFAPPNGIPSNIAYINAVLRFLALRTYFMESYTVDSNDELARLLKTDNERV